MKISILTTSFPRFEGDPAGRFISKYASALTALDCQLSVLSPHDIEVRPGPETSRIDHRTFRYFFPAQWQSLAYGGGMVSRVRSNWLRLMQLPFFMAAFFLSALKSARKAQLMHAFWTPAALVALAVKKIHKKPLVLTLWGSDLLFTRIPIFRTLYRRLIRDADVILCESDHFRSQLETWGIPKERLQVIPNGIDLDRFQPRNRLEARKPLGLPEDGFLFLTVAALNDHKGQRFLIEAIPQVLKNRPTAHFILVGDGETRPALESLAKQLDVAQAITFTGAQPDHTIANWMNAADGFILPSLQDGSPNVLLEAMASGLPVIATSVGGIGDMIRNRENGLIIEPGSAADLAKKACLLMDEAPLRQQLSENSISIVKSQFAGWDDQALKLKQIYSTLLEESTERLANKPGN